MVFPITATMPSYMAWVSSSTRLYNVYYTGETGRGVDLVAPNQPNHAHVLKPFTGNYYIRDYWGTIVGSGALDAQSSVPVPDGLPCGAYRIYLTQAVNDPTYGYAGGAGYFLVVNDDPHFPTFKGVPVNITTHGALPNNNIMHGFTLQGPVRNTDDTPANTQFTANGDTSSNIDKSWYLANPDPARPREQLMLSTNLITDNASWQTAVAHFKGTDGIAWYEGPMNEPSGSAATISSELQNFSTVTKAATAGVKVMGPCPVNFNNQLNPPTGAGYLHNCLADMAAMNPVPIDGISVHGYNCLNGDLSLGHLCYGNLRDTITQVGLQNLPLWHTEQGYIAMEHGVFMPRWQARWTMLMLLLEEQYGIPKEQHVIFKDVDDGSYNVPFNYSDGQGTWFPATVAMRAYSAEVWGKTFASAFDFGTPGNDMMQGSLYTGTDGSGLLAFMSGGASDLTVTLTVTGAASLTVVDCFGNTSSLAVTGGRAVLPLPLEPVYVRLPAGVTAAPVMEWNAAALGTELAASSTPTASGSAANVSATAHLMIDGNQISSYYNNAQVTSRGQANAPYIDDTNAFPAWARFDWATTQTLDRVVVFGGGPPFQAQGTLLDFDVQWLDADGVTWHTERTITEKAQYGTVDDPNANLFGFVTEKLQGGCTVESYFSERWIFPVKFAAKVTTKAIRLYVRAATYGMDPTIEAQTAKGAADTTAFGNNFTIRSVQAFNSTAVAPPPPAGNPFVVRTIT